MQAMLLARGQRELGHQVEIAINRRRGRGLHRTFDPWVAEGFRFHQFWMMEPDGLLCPPWEILRFRGFLSQQRPDVVHVHRDAALLFTSLANAGREFPAFISQRGTTMPFRRGVVARAHLSPKLHRVIAVAEAVKQTLVGEGLPKSKVDVVYGSFDVDRFDPARVDGAGVRRELGLAPNQALVVQVGELNHKKSPETFIKAAALILKQRPDVKFALVGNAKPGREARYHRLGRELCGKSLHFAGWRSDVPEFYAACDVAVNCSSAGEGLTGAIREALALAKPVVATAVDGNPEVVRHDQTGLLVPKLDPPAMAAGILRLLDEREHARALGRAGRELVLELMHPRVRLARVDEIYRTVLEENAARVRTASG